MQGLKPIKTVKVGDFIKVTKLDATYGAHPPIVGEIYKVSNFGIDEDNIKWLEVITKKYYKHWLLEGINEWQIVKQF